MKRCRWNVLAGVWLALVFAGCQQTTGPGRRVIPGNWRSNDFPGGVVRMTLTEASRQVEGAGSWLDEAGPQAFRVRGVLSTDIFSLYFDFQDRADITLEGFFVANDRLTGELVGGEFDGVRVTFQRTGG